MSTYYDAAGGRWTSKDPIDFGGTQLNLYAYAHLDPVNYVDLTGKSPANLFGAVVGGVLGGISAKSEGGDVLQGILIGAVTNGINPGLLVSKFALGFTGNLASQAADGAINRCLNFTIY